MANDLGLSLLSIATGAVAAVLLFGALWLWAVRGGRISLVDVAWGAGFVLVALVALPVSGSGDPDEPTRVLLVVMTAIWGLRLAVHTGRRLARHDTEDPRYQKIIDDSDRTRTSTTLRSVVLPQAAGMVVVSLPITVGQNNAESWLPLTVVGVAVWAVGVFFEAVGDLQLDRFKASRTSSDEIMDRGLWRYTRHPNYFGDVCAWWGIWLVAAYSWVGLVAVVGPALMTYMIIAKTGSKLTEKNMTGSKPGYGDYVARTSAFFPLPPKRSADPSG